MSDFRPFILIPSYNTGAVLLEETVRDALGANLPVRVMIDGSTDGSEVALEALKADHPQLLIWKHFPNRGKGAAVKKAAELGLEEGFTHALAMDADGQHPITAARAFLDAGRSVPTALVMGRPIFGADAPKARLYGRKLTIFWTDLETLWGGLGDTLFGMRLYPLQPLLSAFQKTSHARGFDFDPEIAVRLFWSGCPIKQVDVECRYLDAEQGGVSHFHYLRDNVKLTALHFRLVPEFLILHFWRLLFWKRAKASA